MGIFELSTKNSLIDIGGQLKINWPKTGLTKNKVFATNRDPYKKVVTAEKETGEAQHCLARLENFAVRGVRLVLRQKDSESMAA